MSSRDGGGRFRPSRGVFERILQNEEPCPLPPLDVPRRPRGHALIALSGEIDLTTIPLVRSALVRCLGDRTRTVDIDLSAVMFCDVSGLDLFLEMAQLTERSGALMRLRQPLRSLVRITETTGSGFLLHFGRPGPRPSHDVPATVEGGAVN
ncbi:STAS domain-containing protein [Streptomyces sp. MA15]|uniref:STAS domain-containing protein n=1 Tax=Streptomyces sp. MA15 TaxID=3055061 RepID=UPI0025AFC5BB|nr:STAS domain-containing protein [Streptomyces sp. MA15]MDN3267387.1 STAS domain-containing protein [Streptomyces sp. MA15]